MKPWMCGKGDRDFKIKTRMVKNKILERIHKKMVIFFLERIHQILVSKSINQVESTTLICQALLLIRLADFDDSTGLRPTENNQLNLTVNASQSECE